MKIINPVLRGFYSDPSMIRVGSTYYIATSTFEWWPGVRLNESTDLVHWKELPPALDRTTQLEMRGTASGGGIWAPDLSYADGKFWLVYTDVKVVDGAFKDCTNYLVTAEDIRGPWSEPCRLDGVGFDSSLFHDEDGRKYLVQQTWDFREDHHPFNGITLTEFDTSTMRLRPETARRLWKGTDVRITEGPHLYKKDGWYYLFCAEGGHAVRASRVRGALANARRRLVRGDAGRPVHRQLHHAGFLPAEAGAWRARQHAVGRMVLRLAVRTALEAFHRSEPRRARLVHARARDVHPEGALG